MDTRKFLGRLTPEMLRYPLNSLANEIGVEKLHSISEKEGGKSVYLPRPYDIVKPAIKQSLIEEYNQGGISIEAIADKYEICRNTAQNWLNNR